MVDFRSRSERDQAAQAANTEQTDYKQMYKTVLAENQAVRAKLDAITANHGELQAQFADLLDQFEALKSSSAGRSDDLLNMARNMEDMVATAYKQQGDLMDRFRADIAQRLGGARNSVDDLKG